MRLRPSIALYTASITFALSLTPSVRAQNANDPGQAGMLREILSRLDRLEKENHQLIDEVRELRDQLAARNQTEPAAPASTEKTSERITVLEQRTDDLAQTKVEASQRYPIRVTGIALFNAYVNGRSNGGTVNPTVASLSPNTNTGGATVAQSIIGLEYRGPQTFLGGTVSGSLQMDFFGGTTSSLNHLFRIRTATVNLDWANTSLMVGQDKPLIAPRNPDSLAQVGVSPLTGAGNLWLWQPQARVEERLKVGHDSGVRLQAAVYQTALLGNYSDYVSPTTSATPDDHPRPGIEGRVEFWHRWSDTRRIEIAPGFHFSNSHVEEFSIPSQVFSMDWLIRPLDKLEFSGAFFHGQNVANLGGLQQGFTLFYRPYRVIPVHATGGWAQIRIPVTERLAFDVYGGQEDDRNSDLVAGNIGKNQNYAGNIMYKLAPNVLLSLEAGQLRTTYIGAGNRVNNHYDLAIGYLF